MLFGSHKSNVRPPAVAGSFYPREPGALKLVVQDLLKEAKGGCAGKVRAVIAPHAGYIYSGEVAAEAFRGLGKLKEGIRRLVVIGPAHYVRLGGIAVPSFKSFQTAFGQMPMDLEAIERILVLPQVVCDDRPHEPEHAIEVELPFLMEEFGPVPTVPLLVGAAQAQDVAEVLDILWDDATLVVVSSDLSHYHDFDTAKRLDERTAMAIEQFDEANIGFDDACGALAVRGMLITAKNRGYGIKRLALKNSGETAGGRSRVVGYGAWRVYES